jgi:hypothetical protein
VPEKAEAQAMPTDNGPGLSHHEPRRHSGQQRLSSIHSKPSEFPSYLDPAHLVKQLIKKPVNRGVCPDLSAAVDQLS